MQPLCRKGYSIVMNTWKRYDLLKQSISHYSRCPRLDSIHIVWSEPSPPSDSLRKFLYHIVQLNTRDGRQVELKFDINTEDSLNNRFKEIKDLRTDAIFSIDDDVIFPCPSVEFAFDVWQSASDTMVGFVPRMHWVDPIVCLIFSSCCNSYSKVLSACRDSVTKVLAVFPILQASWLEYCS